MRWCVSIAAGLVAGSLTVGDMVAIAAPSPKSQQSVDNKDNAPSVDLELVIAVARDVCGRDDGNERGDGSHR